MLVAKTYNMSKFKADSMVNFLTTQPPKKMKAYF